MPEGVTSTGWPAVRNKCADLGISFRPWQPDVGRLILAKRDDGKYAATIGGTGLSIPRQVGKTFLVGAIIFALCLLRPNLTVIWTAHRLRTAEETFGKMQAFAKRAKIAPHILKIVLGSGEEEIRFTNGSRILFGARERGFGRGFDEVDVLIFDEAQILSESALDDMVPATNQSRQTTSALLLFMGTPPKPSDPGEVFIRMRSEALTGEDDDTGWVEFGADDGYKPTELPEPLTDADWKQVEKANPSYPQDTPREAILRMRKKLGAESFLREGYGLWDDDAVDSDLFGDGAPWRKCGTDSGFPEAPQALGVAVSVDRSWASIASAAMVERVVDGETVEVPFVASVDRRCGTAWVAAEVKRIQDEHDCSVVLDEKGPAADLADEFDEADVAYETVPLTEYAEACSKFTDRVVRGELVHPNSKKLNDAVDGAEWRYANDRRVVGRRKSSVDVSMLEAAIFAVLGAEEFGVSIW